mmetsp:Transcript_46363/g.115340  ORF Transcript_46363/g.115340 Transcript_46363/m.115340 type:complete len:208 (+) Transcript_46363:2770-3393(+)
MEALEGRQEVVVTTRREAGSGMAQLYGHCHGGIDAVPAGMGRAVRKAGSAQSLDSAVDREVGHIGRQEAPVGVQMEVGLLFPHWRVWLSDLLDDREQVGHHPLQQLTRRLDEGMGVDGLHSAHDEGERVPELERRLRQDFRPAHRPLLSPHRCLPEKHGCGKQQKGEQAESEDEPWLEEGAGDIEVIGWCRCCFWCWCMVLILLQKR